MKHEWLVDGVREYPKTLRAGDFGGFLLAREQAEVGGLTVEAYRRTPFLSLRIPGNPTECRSCPGMTALVLAVSSFGRDTAKISAPAVQSITVDVVTLKPVVLSQPKNQAMQIRPHLTAIDVLTAKRIAVAGQAPSPLSNPYSIGFVDDCEGSDCAVALTQRDEGCPIWAGIIRLHRTLHRFGAGPGVGTNNTGVSCVNYTVRAA